MKYVIICVVSLAFSLNGLAQRISFDKTVVNAGSTIWKKPVTAVFRFTNKDKSPLLIRDVDAGCGCLTPKWTRDPLLKGDDGEISVTYDAMMLGHFDRYIDVYTNADEKPVRIRMKALVNNGEQQTLEELYPYSIDEILLSTNNVEFMDVNAGDSVKAEIEILNNGSTVYTPMLMHLPSYITAEYMPEMIAREDKLVMDECYRKCTEFGGQVSGEHAIGHAKKEYLQESVGDVAYGLMGQIKKVFDPNMILNPGKVCTDL